MGQPAARMLDQTAHGGMIMVGFPLVLIGGMPAARVGDFHMCPMLNPGVPPPPHVGGPITKGSASVMIGGMPAARMGDMLTCAGPPDTIVKGCPTVLIGDSMSGGAGAGGSGGEKSGKAAPVSSKETVVEEHYLNVAVVDSGGFPITGAEYELTPPSGPKSVSPLMGGVKEANVDSGSYDIEIRAITSAKWSKKTAKVGEKVQMTAETTGVPAGEKATLEIHVKDSAFPDAVLKTIETKVQGDKIEGEWELVVDKGFLKLQEQKLKGGGFSAPAYYFVAKTSTLSQRSGLLEYKDDIEFKLKDKDGNPIADKKYRIILPSGEVKEDKLDGSGYAKAADVAPGKLKISINVRDDKFPGA
ncbi:MAG: hypothetical protein E4G91_01225 [Candidatus Zixiibacteriota bacterium]|nr:MAG: hypothetical protein E4G91_01225 [candidate division Zixibacteria bacterium]